MATGILESLWHVTSTEAPAGDIGKLSDEDIAEHIDCGIGHEKLIAGLIGSGWLDIHPVHRLVIHDWHDHADDATKKRLERSETPFASRAADNGGQRRTTAAGVGQNPPACALPDPVPDPEPEPVSAPTRRKPSVAAVPGGRWGKGQITFDPVAAEWHGISDGDRTTWGNAYPAVNLTVELFRAAAWCKANPTNGRKSNYAKFLASWLSRTQDRGRASGQPQQPIVPRYTPVCRPITQ